MSICSACCRLDQPDAGNCAILSRLRHPIAPRARPCHHVLQIEKRAKTLTKLYLILVAAIAAEVVATTALARSESFSRLVPSIVAVLGYVVAFWLLSICLRSIPTGVVYALWSGMGIVLITAVSWVVYQQKLDAPALLGLALILAGVAVINLFSRTVNH